MNNATEFANWLKSKEMIIHLENKFGRFSTFSIFIKLAKNEDIDYLFCMENYDDNTLTREASFQYAGIYCKRDGLVYDAQYSICALEPDEKILKLIDELHEIKTEEVYISGSGYMVA